jgi:peptidoglycan-associated lipoprotein
MRVLVMLLIPLIAACSTMKPAPAPSASLKEPSGVDISGRWQGTWTGTGLYRSAREDTVVIDFVQQGDRGLGRLVLEGTIAAESVPEVVRFQGLTGIRVVAEIRKGTVTLRHQLDGRLFTADLKIADNGDRMYGWVRGSEPAVGLLLTRAEPKAAPARPAPESTPAPAVPQIQSQAPAESGPAPDAVTMVTPPLPEREETARPAERPRQDDFVAVQELPAVRFDFDQAAIRSDTADALVGYAGWLKDHTDTALLIEGHCDERGTPEYNVALGERRAKAVKDYLSTYGVTPDRVSTVSYGKERPACAVATDTCREENRRAEFRVKSH